MEASPNCSYLALQGGRAAPRRRRCEWRGKQRESMLRCEPRKATQRRVRTQTGAGPSRDVYAMQWHMVWKSQLAPPKQPRLIPKHQNQAASGGNMGNSISASHCLDNAETALTSGELERKIIRACIFFSVKMIYLAFISSSF